MYITVVIIILLVFFLALGTIVLSSYYETDGDVTTECAVRKKEEPVYKPKDRPKVCKKVSFELEPVVIPEPEPVIIPEPEPEPVIIPEPEPEPAEYPNLDNYIHRSELKPNITLRSNPYYFENKCRTCKKKRDGLSSIYHPYDSDDDYEYGNVKLDEWIPVEENETCKL
jgi:hypothetical protein